ncbi:hypothetical protein ACIPWI_38585 [Streptomyces sp. NPDC090046]|uniref:hypothetical protein n=1 Tax=Streptomyces sp. NPDC090046 TaxID=3365928 RepID=UPI003814E2CB
MSNGVPAQAVKSVRIVSPHQGRHARIAILSWSNKPDSDDASLYIKPYAGPGWSVKGHSAAELAPDTAATLTAQREYNDPKMGNAQLSLHHSGQSHVYVGPHADPRSRLQPVQGAPLDDPAGGHVATVTWATLDGLPTPDVALVSAGPNIDLVVPTPQDAARMSVAMYSGTDEDAMRERYPSLKDSPLLRMERVGMSAPLFLGFHGRATRGPRQDGPGVVVLGGLGARRCAGGTRGGCGGVGRTVRTSRAPTTLRGRTCPSERPAGCTARESGPSKAVRARERTRAYLGVLETR